MKQVLIVEDVTETRRWLADIVRSAFPACQITEAESVAKGLRVVHETIPFDIALIDLNLPDGSGLDVLRRLRLKSPEALGVVTTVIGDDAHIVAALSAGAAGYVLKEQAPHVLAQQLLQLANDIPALSPTIAKRIMSHFQMTGPAGGCDETLSPREKEVLGLISRGLRNCDVAACLGVAESTIATHIKGVYRKLGISTRAEASWHAIRLGL